MTIPKPTQKFSTKVDVLRNIRIIYLTLKISPMGGRQPYKVCWTTIKKRTRCLNRMVSGGSWTSGAYVRDMARIRLREMGRRTTFRWIIDGRTVAQRRVVTTVPRR